MSADDVLLAVEIISPRSRRTDRITKFAEYADAGIPHYWIIDLGDVATLQAFDLVNGRYSCVLADGIGSVFLTTPALVTIAPDRL